MTLSAGAVAGWLVASAVAASLLLIATSVVAAALRRASGATTAALWSAAFAALLVGPGLIAAALVWQSAGGEPLSMGDAAPLRSLVSDVIVHTGRESGAAVIVALWLLGVAICFGRIASRIVRVRTVIRSAVVLPDDVKARLFGRGCSPPGCAVRTFD